MHTRSIGSCELAPSSVHLFFIFFFNDTATTEIYTLSLHDALPIAIAGTSMGGLVGGLYAMGYSPKEIHDTVAAVDWDAVLRDRLQYRNLIFRRREDLRSHPNSLEFGEVTCVHLHQGFNPGHHIGLLLDRL